MANVLWPKRYSSLGAGALFLLIILLVLLGNVSSPRTFYAPESPEENGTKALVLLMSELGNPLMPEGELKGKQGTSLLFPNEGTSEGEANFLIEWVKQGNRLLVAGDEANLFFNNREIILDKYSFGNLMHQWEPEREQFYFSQVKELVFTSPGRFTADSPGEVLASDNLGPWLIRQKEGKGEILFLSVPEIFTNGYLNKADNLIFVLNLFRGEGEKDPEALYFYQPSTGREALGPVSTWLKERKYLFLGELVLGLMLLFHFWGKRFGRVIPQEAIDPSEKDYGASLAELYRLLGAKDLIMETLQEDLHLFIAGRLGLSGSAGKEEILKELRNYRPRAADSLIRIYQEIEAIQTRQSWSEAKFVHMARQLEGWRRENFGDATS